MTAIEKENLGKSLMDIKVHARLSLQAPLMQATVRTLPSPQEELGKSLIAYEQQK